MTYNEYLSQQEAAAREEEREDSCFLDNQAEGVFVRGH